MADRDLCANCQHWREEHYGVNGEWQGQLFGCSEYAGVEPPDDRAANKADEVRKSRQAITALRAQKAATFYDQATKA